MPWHEITFFFLLLAAFFLGVTVGCIHKDRQWSKFYDKRHLP